MKGRPNSTHGLTLFGLGHVRPTMGQPQWAKWVVLTFLREIFLKKIKEKLQILKKSYMN